MLQIWDKTIPADTELAGDGAKEIRTLKVDLEDHLKQDHQMNDIVDPLQANCSGYHSKVTMYPLDDDPIVPVGAGVVYCKVIDGVQELFFIDESTGTVNQLTENGVISLNTLQNNINGNGKNITGLNALTATGNITSGNTLIAPNIKAKPFAKNWNTTIRTGTTTAQLLTYTVHYPCVVAAEIPSLQSAAVTVLPGTITVAIRKSNNSTQDTYCTISMNGCVLADVRAKGVYDIYFKLLVSSGYDGSSESAVIS